jgi:sulfatase maturation enzyme AslB (radical SAM superfamily)
MSFEKNFCPSPWFHMRINNTGAYEYCRWASKTDRNHQSGIQKQDPIQWFQYGIKDIRQAMLLGQALPGCQECRDMEQYNKISGRLRQRLKIGVNSEDFVKSLVSSPWMPEFKNNLSTDGVTIQWPQDWQIDLGNYCNSACLFCSPRSSSRLAQEFQKLGFINSVPSPNWCEDPAALQKFLDVLIQSPKLCYLHFIGGETLITPAFKIILQALVNNGLNSDVSIGFTTNLPLWNQPIVDLLSRFKQVNLGMSIECLHPLNDYVRYGGNLETTVQLLKRWVDLARQENWLVQLRITPTVLSIWHLDTVYDYAYQNGLAVESCNFLTHPEHMRISVLPREYRAACIKKLQNWLAAHRCDRATQRVVNTRDPNAAQEQLLDDIQSYISYLIKSPDESHRSPDLVRYLKAMEQNRGNSILDYLPEYETFLRSAGY